MLFGHALIITSRDEYSYIQRSRKSNGSRIIMDEELDGDKAVVKARLLRMLNDAYHDDLLIVGIDPGRRMGLTALYMRTELCSEVLSSIADVVYVVNTLVHGVSASRNVIRIGYGEPRMAREIASMLYNRLADRADIELVDEHGTSSNGGSNKRGLRDKASAKAIAMRRGRQFKPYNVVR
ncbi:MAG: hypothetical protein QW560_05410 [Candidatus Nitrosocaldus sp.]